MQFLFTRTSAVLASLVGIGAVGWIDLVSGLEIRVFPLYFLPIALVAWHSGWVTTIVVSTLAALAWFLSNGPGLGLAVKPVLVLNTGTQTVAFLAVGLLIVELRRRLDAEQRLARVDSLTGLMNRRAFEDHARHMLDLARRYKSAVTVAYLDLDNFKAVNDQRGHAIGDRLLVTVAEVLRSSLRSTDLVARLGGDEFACLCDRMTKAAAADVLERLRAKLEETMARHGWPVTASIGALAIEHSPPPLPEILTAADALMYDVKRKGKNHVELRALAPQPVEPVRSGASK